MGDGSFQRCSLLNRSAQGVLQLSGNSIGQNRIISNQESCRKRFHFARLWRMMFTPHPIRGAAKDASKQARKNCDTSDRTMSSISTFEPFYASKEDALRTGHVLRPVARAVAVLRSGDAVILRSQNPDEPAMLLASAESGWKDHAFTQVVMGARQAALFGLNVPDSLPSAVVFTWPEGEDIGLFSAAPSDVSDALKQAELHKAGAVEQAALRLLKYALRLPVGLLSPLQADEVENFISEYGIVSVEVDSVEQYPQAAAQSLQVAGDAHVPLKLAENARVLAFRQPHGMEEHLAIVIGDPLAVEAPLVRLHSSCVTGDILGSLRCDCGDQLQAALARIAESGQGIVLYLNQEGRGIGLANKLKAYALQEAGMDTVTANEALGFDADERDFTMAAAMLRQLGIEQLRLLTNNPRKVSALETAGITITERVPLAIKANPHNADYLKTKEQKCGHLF